MTTTASGAFDASGRSPAAPPSPPSPSAQSAPSPPARTGGAVAHRERRARWERWAFLGLLALTAVLYLVGLGASGWANQFYSAAVQAAGRSWEAFFYGSSDAANFITVDKPPASLWVMDLSARIFGLHSWSILVPQALEGVAAVALLYAAVRRRFSAAAALIAGGVLALTPVAVLMFRFDNPDALLALLLVAAGYAVLRAQEDGRTRWLLLCGACLGFAFLTKTLQMFLVLPACTATYAAFAPTGVWRRLRQLLVGALAMVVCGGWWVAVVELMPARYRPYIGGSQHNSFLELTFGYNGFGRLSGDETGSVGGGAATAGTTGSWGATGIGRLFGGEFAGQIAWLLPAAFLLLIAGVVATWRARRTDGRRAALVMWGLCLVVTFLTFSYMKGIFHPYYTVALAPYVGAVVGIGCELLWQRRAEEAEWRRWAAGGTLAAVVLLTAFWAYRLLDQTPSWQPWIKYLVVLGGLAGAGGLLFGFGARLAARRGLTVFAVVGLLSGLAGPAAYAVSTASQKHTGSLPSAGPAAAGMFGGGGMGGGRRPRAAGNGGGVGNFKGNANGNGNGNGNANGAGGGPGTGFPGGGRPRGGFPGGGFPGGGFPGGAGRGGAARGAAGGGGMSLLDGSTPGAALTALLERDASAYTWVAAAIGSQNSAGYQLATGDPVMTVGGFNGTDPAPTLAEFEEYVRAGKVHYFVGGGVAMGGMGGGGSSGSGDAEQILAWVKKNFTARTVDGVTVYDLTATK